MQKHQTPFFFFFFTRIHTPMSTLRRFENYMDFLHMANHPYKVGFLFFLCTVASQGKFLGPLPLGLSKQCHPNAGQNFSKVLNFRMGPPHWRDGRISVRKNRKKFFFKKNNKTNENQFGLMGRGESNHWHPTKMVGPYVIMWWCGSSPQTGPQFHWKDEEDIFLKLLSWCGWRYLVCLALSYTLCANKKVN